MSGMPENDSAARGHPMNGTGGDALRTRIADLLDDVTVDAGCREHERDVLAASDAAGALAHAGNEQPASVFPYQAAAPAEITPPVDSPPPLIVPPAPAETRPSTDLPVVPSAEVGQPSDRIPPPIAGTTSGDC